ncbi:putative major capsid protein [Alteromonas phage vB_AspP-H4/4]|uniref:Major capsid protein n=1 Tax=Alteromonas phage vB_AspP-H4/4 TaxID=2928692 RepID=A0A220YL69_9CAUD|nr:major head protein [Alteromonas phage vB_AspP-H4/4]ASL24417.1 putative major capsid protein [Alteromonas phage vB_AspP-H4/4]
MSIIGQPVAQQQVRSGHQGGVDSGNINPLYIEQYGGEVEHRFVKDSFMRQFFKFKSVRGTDTITNDRIGFTALQKVSRGVRPTDSSPTFDNISVKVDTIVLARTNQFLLDDFLSHIDVRKEVGMEHGKTIGKFFDESFIVQAIKAAQITNQDPDGNLSGGWDDVTGTSIPSNIVRTAPEGFQGGSVITLAAAGDEEDPDLLELAIQDLCQKIEEKDVDIMDGVLLMRPAQYYTLLRNDKLLDRDFSTANGDYASGTVLRANGVRVQVTNRFPSQEDVGQTHFLSNAGNGNAYNATQADVNCKVLLLMPKALLAGETIPLTSKVYYHDVELQWFIDSYLAYGVTPNRAEMAGGIFRVQPAVETPV